jgi:hypothetical protein
MDSDQTAGAVEEASSVVVWPVESMAETLLLIFSQHLGVDLGKTCAYLDLRQCRSPRPSPQ